MSLCLFAEQLEYAKGRAPESEYEAMQPHVRSRDPSDTRLSICISAGRRQLFSSHVGLATHGVAVAMHAYRTVQSWKHVLGQLGPPITRFDCPAASARHRAPASRLVAFAQRYSV
jgi:hypothetical protein